MKTHPQDANSARDNSKTGPPYLSYREFFQDVVTMDMAAPHTDTAEKSSGSGGYRLDDQAGLTTEEGMLLKLVAYHYSRAAADYNVKAREEIRAIRSLNRLLDQGKMAPVPPAVRREHAEEGDRIVNTHIEQLKQLLGEASFLKVDRYVKRRFKATPAN